MGAALTPRPFHATDEAVFRVAVAPDLKQTVVNLAPDGDLEVDPVGSYYTNGIGSFSSAADVAHFGSRALKLVASGPSGALARWMTQTARTPVTPGRTYRVSAWVRTNDVSGSVTLAATFYDGTYRPSLTATPVLGGTTGWTELSELVTVPAGVTNLRAEVRLYGSGTLWADDVSMKEQ